MLPDAGSVFAGDQAVDCVFVESDSKKICSAGDRFPAAFRGEAGGDDKKIFRSVSGTCFIFDFQGVEECFAFGTAGIEGSPTLFRRAPFQEFQCGGKEFDCFRRGFRPAGKIQLGEEDFRFFIAYAVLIGRRGKSEIRRGFIAPTPIGGACTYCRYKGMCAALGEGIERNTAGRITCKQIADIVRRDTEGE